MFTGLVEEIGIIKAVRPTGDGVNIEVSCNEVLEGTSIGDSLSINGACQTVTALGRDTFTVYASKITCETTTLGSFRSGLCVNLERAMQTGSRFGGHMVQGHVDGKGEILNLKSDSDGLEISIKTGQNLLRYIASKGSVAVDGISLTVVSLNDNGFLLYVIPESLSKTTVPQWKTGDDVNIEVDILAKYVERMLSKGDEQDKGESLKLKLMEEGYL
jgi:riboflavin synthase